MTCITCDGYANKHILVLFVSFDFIYLCVIFAIIIIQLDVEKMTIYRVEGMRRLPIKAIDFETHILVTFKAFQLFRSH